MCNITKALQRAFTAPGTGGLEAAAEQAQGETKRQIEAAQKAAEAEQARLTETLRASQEEARRQSAAVEALASESLAASSAALESLTGAAASPADQESARAAAERRMRRLISASTRPRARDALGAPPVGYRQLTGA